MKKKRFKLRISLFGIGMSGMCLLVMIIFYFIFGSSVWEYFPIWFWITIFAVVIGLFIDYVEYDGRKEVCHFCKKQLGDTFSDGKSRYNKNDDDLWAHKICIPNKLLRKWCKTQ